MNRVRYSKEDENGLKESVSKVLGNNGEELQVVLNTKDNTFKVVVLPEKFLKAEGSGKSYQLMLRQVKSTLLGLGVGLTTESRNRDGVTGGSSTGEAMVAKGIE